MPEGRYFGLQSICNICLWVNNNILHLSFQTCMVFFSVVSILFLLTTTAVTGLLVMFQLCLCLCFSCVREECTCCGNSIGRCRTICSATPSQQTCIVTSLYVFPYAWLPCLDHLVIMQFFVVRSISPVLLSKTSFKLETESGRDLGAKVSRPRPGTLSPRSRDHDQDFGDKVSRSRDLKNENETLTK